MSEIFPPNIDSAETDETAGEEKHKNEEIIQLTGLQLKDKSGGEKFNTLVWEFRRGGWSRGEAVWLRWSYKEPKNDFK